MGELRKEGVGESEDTKCWGLGVSSSWGLPHCTLA